MDKRLTNIIRHYKKTRQGNPDRWVINAQSQKTLSDAIRVSALAIDTNGKRNPHQRFATVWDKRALKTFADLLIHKEYEIRKTNSFEALLSVIEDVNLKGIGPLTKYDTAMRIGMYLKIQPTKIYLHAGTRIGAEKILGKIPSPFVLKTDLPPEFEKLECWEIEDVLCIYKRNLKPKN